MSLVGICCAQDFTATDWIENVRVSKTTFAYICINLGLSFNDNIPGFVKPSALSIKWQLCTLCCLATCGEYHTIVHLFGIARCVSLFMTIVTTMMSQCITFLKGDDLKEVITDFTQKWRFIQCTGVIDGTHIPVRAQTMSHTNYYNRKGWYSIIVLSWSY